LADRVGDVEGERLGAGEIVGAQELSPNSFSYCLVHEGSLRELKTNVFPYVKSYDPRPWSQHMPSP